ncbi:hypothetical protein [Halorhabdus rudnickae]|uniref:hypothetical protein n=1 Tax=Halorhabdus rudnickae TaxID=1775544 RepID=UPI0010848D95|nr:hypothetical protein [Halorhabdus rudnickae]
MLETIPDECQLCRPLEYRGEDLNSPEGMVEIARIDGGAKIIHCCRRCAEELFTNPDFTEYDTDTAPEQPPA